MLKKSLALLCCLMLAVAPLAGIPLPGVLNASAADGYVWGPINFTGKSITGGEYVSGNVGIQIGDKTTATMGITGNTLQIAAISGNYKTINIQVGGDAGYGGEINSKSANIGGTNFYWNKANGFEPEVGKEYTVTFDAAVVATGGVTTGKVRVRGNNTGDWAETSLTTAAKPVSHTYTQAANGGNLQIETGSTATGVPVAISNLKIAEVVSGGDTPPPATTETEIYNMQKDLKNAQIGAFNGTNILNKAGGPTVSVVANGGGKALSVTGRTADWHAVDIVLSKITLNSGCDYKFIVEGNSVAANTPMKIAQTSDPWFTYVSGAVGADGGFKMEKTLTYDVLTQNITDGQNLRITSTQNSTGNFDIYNIQIIEIGGGTPKPPKEPLEATKTFIPVDFEDGTPGPCYVRGDGNGQKIEVVEDATVAHLGTKYLAVTGRTNSWNGMAFSATDYITSGKTYEFSAWVRLAEPGSSTLKLNFQKESDGTNSYPAFTGATASATVKDSEWVQLLGIYTFTGAYKGDTFSPYIESASGTASYYVDDINFREVADPTATTPDWKDKTPLKNTYAGTFMVGTTSGGGNLSGDKLDIVNYHFDAFTPENEMKPDGMQKVKGTFTFTAMDAIFAKLDPSITKIGHTLVWHSQSPEWMWSDDNKEALSKDEALDNMREHINGVMGQYGSELYSIDVVNEAMSDGPRNPEDWEASLRKSGWYDALGSDLIYEAFIAARNAAPGVKLYYNDYNLDSVGKSTAVYNMVKAVNERYVAAGNSGTLIDGVGMQGHYSLSTSVKNVENSIKLFSSLPGVSVSITELDVTIPSANGKAALTDSQTRAQGIKYAELFQVFKKYAVGNGGRLERVTFWGTNDGDSWRGPQFPLLFNKSLTAKEAFYAVQDPDGYLAANPPIEERNDDVDCPIAETTYGTPTMDETVDSAWAKAEIIQVARQLTAHNGATAKVRTLWDNDNLYVLAEVSDPVLSKESGNAYEQDSVELFVSETDHKTTAYREGDGHYRVNFDNEESFDGITDGTGFESVAWLTDTGYTVKSKIPFKMTTPVNGKVIGFDASVNDATGATRTANAVWYDASNGSAYQDTSGWGRLRLVSDSGGSGGSSSSSSSSGGGGGSGSSTPTTVTSSNVSSNGSINSQAVVAEAGKVLAAAGNSAVLRSVNAVSISPSALKSLASAAQKAGKSLILNADTLGSDNKTVQGRLYIEPSKLTNLKGDLKLGIITEPAKTSATKATFEKFFDNKVAVIRCEQQGTFGAKLKIAAKVDLTGMDAGKLVFYSYDKATKIYTQIANTSYFIDKNGYLHFYTELAGDIIVSTGPLKKK